MPPSTVTVPPPRSVRMGAEDRPEVVTSRSYAVVTPPPVVMRPPEPSPVVTIFVFRMMTVVPSPAAPFRPPLPP